MDAVKFCPHHPDKGYPEENPVYKVPCECRKPKPGMILEVAKQYHIDLAESWMIGDCTIDVQTGVNAGTHTILLRTGEGGNDKKFSVEPDYIEENIRTAVKRILG